jgi:hypothetical protein
MITKFSDKNQPIWEKFYTLRYAEVIERQKEKGEVNEISARVNLAVYKEAAILLDSLCDDFTKLTLKVVERAKAQKRANHINGFLLECCNQGWIKLRSDVVISLIPAEYQNIVRSLVTK